MADETYTTLQVSGGKMHGVAVVTRDRDAWTDAYTSGVTTVCGVTVHPVNLFGTQADALRYCGGRREYLCKRCTGH